MSTTGLEVFDRTVHTTNVWLHEIAEDLGPDRNRAWHVLGAVLRCLRDQLPAELAAHLAAQLPLLVRGAFYDAWNPSAADRRAKSDKEFLAKLADQLAGTRPTNSEQAARVVFGVLARHVDREQIAKVRNALSEKVRRLWPEALHEREGEALPVGRHRMIEQRAYEIWRRKGEPDGEDLDHWLEAEYEIDHGVDAPARIRDKPKATVSSSRPAGKAPEEADSRLAPSQHFRR
jgi:uncharacterized protein (DUF2267 family)